MTWLTASSIPQRRAFALTAIAAAVAGTAHAQTPPKPVRTDDPNAPIVIKAEEVTGRPERQLNLDRNIEITRGQTRVTGDTACYRMVEDEVSAQGHINMYRFGDHYRGDELQLNMSTGQGWVLKPQYRLEMNNAQGQAARLDFINDEQAVVTRGTYSTCEGPNPDWYLTASTLTLDQGRDVGVASSTVVYFKGVPIIGAPGMSFSLSGARRSGWLPPSIGLGSKGNGEVTIPYYFNIAPNRDLTVAPRVILSRGLQFLLNGRYLGETAGGMYSGETALEYLHHDKQTNTERWLLHSQHTQAIVPGWSYGWVVRAASDNLYPSDFSKSINNSAERQLVRELRTDYTNPFWSLSARAQGWQVLQDPAAARDATLTVPRPYDRLPQVTFHAGRYDVNGFDWAIDADVTRFWHPDQVRGNREVVQPQVSYPVVAPGYFITPKLMLNATRYQLDGDIIREKKLPYDTQYSRTLPTFSLDSGLVFEREARLLGLPVTQTLEPRLFYVYTPYRDQRAFPNFDSAEAGFNFAQLFTENRFIGMDRIADANQATAALVSRFIEPSGAERLRLAVGQRFYVHTPRVFFDNAQHTERRSDLLLAASGRVTSEWNFDSAVQYNGATHQVYQSNYGVQWTPGDKKVINAEYRYTRDSYQNLDVSSQWPIAARWYGVGRVSYSLRDRKLLESLVGLEYKADCWVFRMGAQRFVTAAQTVSTPMFFQLELNGLSKLGFNNALDSFYKSIPGYSRLNQAAR